MGPCVAKPLQTNIGRSEFIRLCMGKPALHTFLTLLLKQAFGTVPSCLALFFECTHL